MERLEGVRRAGKASEGRMGRRGGGKDGTFSALLQFNTTWTGARKVASQL